MFNFIKSRKLSVFVQWALLFGLVVLLAVSVYVFVRNFEVLRSEGYIKVRARHQLLGQQLAPEQIRGWMTFRYVNLLFNLPTGYLQNSLNITDRRYPNLSINTAAKEQKISSVEFLVKISAAIKSFNP